MYGLLLDFKSCSGRRRRSLSTVPAHFGVFSVVGAQFFFGHLACFFRIHFILKFFLARLYFLFQHGKILLFTHQFLLQFRR